MNKSAKKIRVTTSVISVKDELSTSLGSAFAANLRSKLVKKAIKGVRRARGINPGMTGSRRCNINRFSNFLSIHERDLLKPPIPKPGMEDDPITPKPKKRKRF